MAYLCNRAAWVSIPGDAVHFTSFAFGESPHGTVQLSSREAICNNTSGIETVEREETPAAAFFEKKKKKAQKSDLSGSDAAGIHRLPFTWTGRQVSHGSPECSAGTMRPLWRGTIRTTIRATDIVDKLLRSVCGSKAKRDKRVLEGNVYEVLAYNWSLAAVSLDAP